MTEPHLSAAKTAPCWKSTEALKLLNGDSELLRELCQIFLQESPKLLQSIKQSLSDKDADGVMRGAHSIRGEVSYLGAPKAVQAAAELEEMGRGDNLGRGKEVFSILERELEDVHIGLQNLMGASS
ncbi:MAG: Hpt domain-containing protein [Acidobacteriaceae bacterium]